MRVHYMGCAWSTLDPAAWLRALLPPILIQRRVIIGLERDGKSFVYGIKVEVFGFFWYITTHDKESLLRRLPGVGDQIGRMVAEFADYEQGIRLRTWADIRPERPNDPLPSRWVAWACARYNDQYWRFPVIDDDGSDRIIKESDQPDRFVTLPEAERAAEKARCALETELLEQIKGART